MVGVSQRYSCHNGTRVTTVLVSQRYSCHNGTRVTTVLVSQRYSCHNGTRVTTVLTKNCSNHEIFITKINIHVIFNSFKTFLNHGNLELYGI